MKLSEEYPKDMKRMKIANIVVWAVGIITVTLFITFTINWLLYFFHMDNAIEGNKLVSIIVELITGIIFLCLMLYDHKAIKKRMKVGKPYIFDLNKKICYESLFKMPEYHKQEFRKGEL